MKKIYIIIALAALIFFGFLFLGNNQREGSFIEVVRGDVVREVFESGTIKRGDVLSVGFKEAGRIENIFKEEGDIVKKGDIIASQEKDDLEISLRDAKAGLSSAESALEMLFFGASEEEREIARSAVRSAKTALSAAEDNLEKQKKVTEETKESVYKEIPSLLGEVYLDAKETKELVDDLANEHFGGFVVSETVSGRRSRDKIRSSAREIEKYRELARSEAEYEELDMALEETKRHLRIIVAEMDNILDVAESDFYENKFTDNQVESLRTYRRLTNTNLSKTDSTQKTISSVKAEISSLLSSARSQVDSAESSLDQAERELSRVEADPRDTDIRIKEAAVEQAKARVELLEKRIADTTLQSPVSGKISTISSRAGEIVAAGSPIMNLVPDEKFYIEIDIYEGDVVEVEVGDSASVSFLAFEDEEFSGEVVFINPTGKVVDGIIYYSARVMLEEYPEEVRTEMTVDVTIRTEERNDVIFLPERNIQRREGRNFVIVLENGEQVEKEVELGIRGEGRVVEILSGLEEGEKVLTE